MKSVSLKFVINMQINVIEFTSSTGQIDDHF